MKSEPCYGCLSYGPLRERIARAESPRHRPPPHHRPTRRRRWQLKCVGARLNSSPAKDLERFVIALLQPPPLDIPPEFLGAGRRALLYTAPAPAAGPPRPGSYPRGGRPGLSSCQWHLGILIGVGVAGRDYDRVRRLPQQQKRTLLWLTHSPLPPAPRKWLADQQRCQKVSCLFDALHRPHGRVLVLDGQRSLVSLQSQPEISRRQGTSPQPATRNRKPRLGRSHGPFARRPERPALWATDSPSLA